MDESQYSLVLDGSLRDGVNPDQTKARLAALFKISVTQVDRRILTGKSVVVKKGITRETAERLQRKLEAVGRDAGLSKLAHRHQHQQL